MHPDHRSAILRNYCEAKDAFLVRSLRLAKEGALFTMTLRDHNHHELTVLLSCGQIMALVEELTEILAEENRHRAKQP